MPSNTDNSDSTRHYRRRRLVSSLFAGSCGLMTVLCVVVLGGLLVSIVAKGWSGLSWTLLTNLTSRFPEKAGIKHALFGSVWIAGLTALFSVPLGVGAAVYLEEYTGASRLRRVIQLNIANLAGVPSIVYGILGLGLFVRALQMGATILAASLTMTLVVLPIVILASQEALRSVPGSIRQASHALGATRWQTIWRQVLPASAPGIMTGVILAVSRALGEAAPLVAIGAAASMSWAPMSPTEQASGLPLLIYHWAAEPKEEFKDLAASGILVLLGTLLLLNAGAVFVRYRYGKRIKW
ncbi:MAG: phosphate ABC transporter permease PstA [Planctomycetota bacterium]